MKVSVNSMLRTLSVAAILGAASGAATAQPPADGNFKNPLRSGAKAAPAQESSHSTMVMRQEEGDNALELRIEDGEYSAKLNGKKVPQDRIVKENDAVRILDADGNTVGTFHISTVGGFGEGKQPPKASKTTRAPKGSGGSAKATPAPMAEGDNPPKVMVGIIMDAPSDSLRKNYGLKDGEAILVQRVIDGLPADRAGLKENDIITEIDGKKPVNQEILRDVLRSKEPGDTVEVSVLRKGGDKSLRITLDKFDQSKLETSVAIPDDAVKLWGNGDAGEALRDAMKNHPQWRSLTIPGDGQGRAFVMGDASPDMDRKLADLDKKMADLDKKIEQVNAQMSKLQDLIEKLSQQRGR